MRRLVRFTARFAAIGALAGCGKSAPPPVADATMAVTGGDVAATHPDDVAGADVAGGDGAADDGVGDAGDAADLAKLFAKLGALEVAGMTRTRSTVQSDYVTLSFQTATPNALGNTGTIEVTIGACPGCEQATKAELEGRKEQALAQLGELHAKNPKLVYAIDDIALAPARSGVATYVRSFVDDGLTRAALHTLEVSYVASDFSVRLLAYPRSSFPQSDKELGEAFTKDELVAAAKAVFAAAAAVIWP